MSLGFGIIGCGLIANFHAQAIAKAQGAKLVAVSDTSLERAEEFAGRYHVQAFGDYKKMLALPQVDVVSICTPSGLHGSLAMEAAQAGKHVVVEKPLSITMEQGRAALAACKEHNVKLAVISQLRFAPTLIQAKAALDEGKLGTPLLGDAYMKYYRSQDYYGHGGWRGTWKMDGGGALMNQGIHGIDLLLWLMGPVTRVWGQARTMAREIEVEDTAIAAVNYASGAMGVIEGTTSVYPGYNRKLEFHGDKGTITFEEEQITKWDLAGEEDKVFVSDGATASGARDPGAISSEGHQRQIQDMVDAIREDRDPLVTGTDGLRAVQLILAIYQSSKEGRPIEIKEEDLHV
jgi:predicted dehydrogenase